MTEEQWQAIRDCNPAYDGVFYCALRTTKVICRPSCRSRMCNPKNIVIFDTLEEGINAGYRPCKRCHSDIPGWKGAQAELAQRAKAYISQSYIEKFSLAGIAKALCIDKIYLSKSFKAVTGTTLLRYHNKMRCDEACRLLKETALSIEVIGARLGFSTSSHFARVFKSFYHCSPTDYRKKR